MPRRAAIVDRDRRVDCFGQEADRDAHECKGLNACKGLGGCKTDTNECKGRNECKAMGGCKSAPADCGPGPDAE